MRFIATLLVLTALLQIPACDPSPPDPMPIPDAGMGGAGGSDAGMVSSSSATSSSSSSGMDAGAGDTCPVEVVIAECRECKTWGCPMPVDTDQPCPRIGVVHYTDMIGCIQLIPGVCPACPANPMTGDAITEACAQCVAANTACSMDCIFEAHGGCVSSEGRVISCERCMDFGCEIPLHQPGQCDESVAVYETFVGCATTQHVLDNCPACAGVGVSTPMPVECSDCAKQHSPCSFDCALELSK